MKISYRIYILIATIFYVGYLPFIPGTFGSLAGLAIFLALNGNVAFQLTALFIILYLGFLSSGKAEEILGKKDPGCVVIDEVAGMLITFLFIPLEIKTILIGFLVFRLMDTVKPFPAYGLQKKHGSIGIMGDDIVAGIYSNLVLQVVLRFISFMGA
jgi:phosphatidylglycerophosphatase A